MWLFALLTASLPPSSPPLSCGSLDAFVDLHAIANGTYHLCTVLPLCANASRVSNALLSLRDTCTPFALVSTHPSVSLYDGILVVQDHDAAFDLLCDHGGVSVSTSAPACTFAPDAGNLIVADDVRFEGEQIRAAAPPPAAPPAPPPFVSCTITVDTTVYLRTTRLADPDNPINSADITNLILYYLESTLDQSVYDLPRMRRCSDWDDDGALSSADITNVILFFLDPARPLPPTLE